MVIETETTQMTGLLIRHTVLYSIVLIMVTDNPVGGIIRGLIGYYTGTK